MMIRTIMYRKKSQGIKIFFASWLMQELFLLNSLLPVQDILWGAPHMIFFFFWAQLGWLVIEKERTLHNFGPLVSFLYFKQLEFKWDFS